MLWPEDELRASFDKSDPCDSITGGTLDAIHVNSQLAAKLSRGTAQSSVN
jgi:hypothetical protein